MAPSARCYKVEEEERRRLSTLMMALTRLDSFSTPRGIGPRAAKSDRLVEPPWALLGKLRLFDATPRVLGRNPH